MANPVVIHKNRTNVVEVHLGIDVSTDVITSEIRTQPSSDSPLLATWEIEYVTDGTDGELLFTLPASVTTEIRTPTGYMDIKRVSGGVAIPVFELPLEVSFRGTVTL